MFLELLIYAITGAVAGLLAGLLGIGGGLIIVPVLTTAFIYFLDAPQHIVHMAVATSLATILITGISSVRTHHAHQAVCWDLVFKMLAGILIGGFLGAWVSKYISSSWLGIIFGVIELLIAFQMIFGRQPNPSRNLPGVVGLNTAGVGAGGLASLLGMGGGAITTPYFVWCNVAMRNAIATSSAFSLPVALSGTIGYMIAGYGLPDLPEYSTGFVYWPAFWMIVLVSVFTAHLGAKMAHRVPVKTLKRIFGFLLIGLGIKMLIIS